MKLLDILSFKKDIENAIENNESLTIKLTVMKNPPSVGSRVVPYNIANDTSLGTVVRVMKGEIDKLGVTMGEIEIMVECDILKVLYKNIKEKDTLQCIVTGLHTSLYKKHLDVMGDLEYNIMDVVNNKPYNTVFNKNEKTLLVSTAWGEVIGEFKLYKTIEFVHEHDIDLIATSEYCKKMQDLNMLVVLTEKLFVTDIVSIIRIFSDTKLIVIHLGNYDAYCIVEQEVILKLIELGRPLNITAPTHNIKHIVGSKGKNIKKVLSDNDLAGLKINIIGVDI